MRYIVSGRVQGVGFRYFVQSVARRESLTGWVRNLEDGRVEAAVAGERDALDRFDRAIRQGPPGARVDKVVVDETFPMALADHAAGFFIR
jgi:acylphosphatase